MKMISPDGKVSIKAHPSKVESLLNMGWKEEAVHSQDKIVGEIFQEIEPEKPSSCIPRSGWKRQSKRICQRNGNRIHCITKEKG